MVHVHVSYEMKYHQMRVISSGLQEGTSLRAGSFVQKLGKIMKKRGGRKKKGKSPPPLFSPVLPNFCTNEPARRLGGTCTLQMHLQAIHVMSLRGMVFRAIWS